MYNFTVVDPSSIGGTDICACDEDPCETAVAEPASAAHSMRLHIAEAPLSWEVTIEFEDLPAESFEVELAGNNAYILLRDVAPVALTFPHPIDAAASIGECGDGILRLSLGKELPRTLGPVIP
jgi:hypothetical protein